MTLSIETKTECDHGRLTTAYCPFCGIRNPRGTIEGLRAHLATTVNGYLLAASRKRDRGVDYRRQSKLHAKWSGWLAALDSLIEKDKNGKS